jgi:hypothetical protein
MSAVRLMPSVRRLLVRRPWIHWSIVVACALATAATVLDRVERIDEARQRWGTTRTVLVAARDIAPGDPLVVVARELPAAMVTESALDAERADDAAAVARQHIAEGEIVTVVDVGRHDRSGPLGLAPDGWLAVPIVESPASGAAIGDRVQLAGDGMVIAGEAIVVGYHDDVTLVAVPADVAPLVPAAAESGGLVVLLAP